MAESPTVLTISEARALFLTAQFLEKPAETPILALERLVSVQTQYAASLPGALAARSKTYPAGWADRTLERGVIAKSWTLRHTVHTQTSDTLELILASLGPFWRKRLLSWFEQASGVPVAEIPAIEAAITEAIKDRPLTRQELHQKVPFLAGLPWAGWGLDVKGLAFKGALSFANNEGVTRFRLRDSVPHHWSQESAAQELMLRYFAGYGPATLKDFTYWSSMPSVMAKSTFQAIRDRLTAVSVTGIPGDRYVLGVIAPAAPKSVRLLPKFDALALAHRDKSLFFTPETSELVFRMAGQIEALVLARGEVVGTWRTIRSGRSAKLILYPHKRLAKQLVERIERTAQRMATRIGLDRVTFEVSH